LKEGSVAAIRDASRDVFLLLRYGSKGRSNKGKDRSSMYAKRSDHRRT